MCILFYYMDPNPSIDQYRLIIASNRDEYYNRPAKDAFHCTQTNIIGGRDMEPGREGGMWLGASVRNNLFKFGVLLNVTGEEHKLGDQHGRGRVVYDYLNDDTTLLQYLNDLKKESYNAFNFVGCEIGKNQEPLTAFYSNCPETYKLYRNKQILCFGNSGYDCPLTKVKIGKQIFEQLIFNYNNINNKEELLEQLLKLLKNPQRHLPDPELKRRAPNAYEHLSSIYVNILNGGYGTRTHSIILIDYNYNVEFIELTKTAPIDPNNPQWTINKFQLQI